MRHIRKSGKRLSTFIYAGVLLVGLSLTTGCANIPVGIGLGVAGGIAYYAFRDVHGNTDEVKKKDLQGGTETSKNRSGDIAEKR